MWFAKYVVGCWLAVVPTAQAQETSTESTRARRVAIEAAVTLSGTAASIGAGLGVGFGVAQRCQERFTYWSEGLGCGISGATALLSVTFATLPVALTLGSYLPHRALGGRGKWWTSLLGAAVGIGGGLGIVSLPASAKDDGAPLIAGVVVGSLLATSMPILALELSHGRQQRVAPRHARSVLPMASALPSGGAWVGVAGTL